MKCMHLADLHIGKRVMEYSMLEDQRYILNQILDIVKEEAPDVVLIAGDVYDKSVPAAEAVTVLDDFLVSLTRLHVKVLMISGNHDSAERLSFGGRLMEAQGLYIAPVFHGEPGQVTIEDAYGPVHFYMLPYVKPANVRAVFMEQTEDEQERARIQQLKDYNDAVGYVLEKCIINKKDRNVLLSHQLVTGAKTCDSEELLIGGMENVNYEVYEDFDYVALGHIHGPQKVGRETIRYAGTPLKYSFSEKNHKKSVTIVELGKKGDVSCRQIRLKPLRDMDSITGTFAQLMDQEFVSKAPKKDYLEIVLTDELEIPGALARLRQQYPYIMKLRYDNQRTRANVQQLNKIEEMKKNPAQLFSEFYRMQNGVEMDEWQTSYIRDMCGGMGE